MQRIADGTHESRPHLLVQSGKTESLFWEEYLVSEGRHRLPWPRVGHKGPAAIREALCIVHLWARSDATDATDATWNLKMGLLSSVAATCKETAGLASMAFACLALSISRVWSCSFKEPSPESMAWEGPSFAWWSRHLRMGSPCFSYWLIINNINIYINYIIDFTWVYP